MGRGRSHSAHGPDGSSCQFDGLKVCREFRRCEAPNPLGWAAIEEQTADTDCEHRSGLRSARKRPLLKEVSKKPMSDATAFLKGLDTKAKMFAPAAWATYHANEELCSWLMSPLARWAGAAYGDRAFDDAATGYAKYCMGVWKSQQMYEKQ